ncbi:MAG TPA: dihydrolipoamide acetyltransferase family protein [Pseudonocardia sp.]
MSRQVFTLPDLGEGLTEAELVRWLVRVGDTITVDAPVAEVETAKAIVEVPSPYAGVIAELHGAEGGTLDVGSPLITVDHLDSPAAAGYVAEERAGSGNVLIGYGTSEQPVTGRRRVRRVASGATPAVTPPAPAGPATAPNPLAAAPIAPVAAPIAPARPVADAPVAPARPGAERPRVASPLVRQLARREGVDLAALIGSGPTGLITRGDVQRAAVNSPATDPATATEPADTDTTTATATDRAEAPGTDRRTGLAVGERIPLRGVRKVIAQALSRSRAEIPEATTWVDVDATELIALRASLAVGEQRAPSLLAFLARFVVTGLRAYPELNARIDTEREEIVRLDGVNLGIATQTDRGLLVPAVLDADRLSVRALDTGIRRVTDAARAGTASSAELTRGSFTLNNYGVFGVDGSAAIINYPEVAILGLGRIIARPWVVGGEVVPRQIGQLSLVFDHRACDGGASGGFLRHVADAVEHPLAALVEG